MNPPGSYQLPRLVLRGGGDIFRPGSQRVERPPLDGVHDTRVGLCRLASGLLAASTTKRDDSSFVASLGLAAMMKPNIAGTTAVFQITRQR